MAQKVEEGSPTQDYMERHFKAARQQYGDKIVDDMLAGMRVVLARKVNCNILELMSATKLSRIAQYAMTGEKDNKPRPVYVGASGKPGFARRNG